MQFTIDCENCQKEKPLVYCIHRITVTYTRLPGALIVSGKRKKKEGISHINGSGKWYTWVGTFGCLFRTKHVYVESSMNFIER